VWSPVGVDDGVGGFGLFVVFVDVDDGGCHVWVVDVVADGVVEVAVDIYRYVCHVIVPV
jgi:hypothetical protein